MEIHFRDYREADFLILEKYVFSFYEALLAFNQEGIKITASKIRATVNEFALKPEKGRFVIFEINQIIVGYALLVFYWSMEYGGNFIFIDEIFVEQAHRNQGISSTFFQWLESEFRGKAVGFFLEVEPSNDRALTLYQRMGFVPYIRPHYFKESS